MSVKNHVGMNIVAPDSEQARNRLAVPLGLATVPDVVIPNGEAIEASETMTEVTLPCILGGTVVCNMVITSTLATAIEKPSTTPPAAMNQKSSVSVRAIKV
jgi:hypothetical protein